MAAHDTAKAVAEKIDVDLVLFQKPNQKISVSNDQLVGATDVAGKK